MLFFAYDMFSNLMSCIVFINTLSHVHHVKETCTENTDPIYFHRNQVKFPVTTFIVVVCVLSSCVLNMCLYH